MNLRAMWTGDTGRRLRRFVVVGGVAALVQTLLLWLFVEVADLYYIVGAVVAIEVTIVSQYFLNNAWTFSDRSHEDRSSVLSGLLRTNLVRGTAIPIQAGLLFALVQFAGVAVLAANLVAIFFSGFYRYALDARWTWR